MDVLEYIEVVNLPGGGLFPSGIIAHLEVSNFIPCQIDVWNQVSFMNLLVIEVIQYLTGWTVYCPANLVSLRDLI